MRAPSLRSSALLVLPMLAVLMPCADAAVFRVGPPSDAACTHATVASALLSWQALPTDEPTEIRIARGQPYTAQALVIGGTPPSRALRIEGGFADCSAPISDTDGDRLVLDGSGGSAAPVIAIADAGTNRLSVNLANLELRGGDPAGDGGGLRIAGTVDVQLYDVAIRDNDADHGGGIALAASIDGAPTLLVQGSHARPSRIAGNTADEGGGLHCIGGARVILERNTAVEGNSAAGNGGGLAMHQCQLLAFMGAMDLPEDPTLGIHRNEAGGDGGGAWADGGVFSVGAYNQLRPFAVSGNHADGDGGAFFVRGMTASAISLRLDDNSAGGRGGAVAVGEGANFGLSPGVHADPCRDGPERCTRLRGNHAAQGGAIHAAVGALSVLVMRARIEDNEAASGSVLQHDDPTGFTNLDTVQMRGNHGAAELLRAAGGGFSLRHASVTRNGNDDTALLRLAAAGSITLTNSVLHDDDPTAGTVLDAPAGTTLSGGCVLAQERASLDLHASLPGVVVGAPQWDPASPDYLVPMATSPAIDACENPLLPETDLRGSRRPLDLSDAPNGAGALDMGAIERPRPSAIFASGFEDD